MTKRMIGRNGTIGRDHGSALGCEVALAAVNAAGERGVPLALLEQLVMHIGQCSQDAAYQQLHGYVRWRIAVTGPKRRGRGFARESQVWIKRVEPSRKAS
jgi:hypothetical protein